MKRTDSNGVTLRSPNGMGLLVDKIRNNIENNESRGHGVMGLEAEYVFALTQIALYMNKSDFCNSQLRFRSRTALTANSAAITII